MPRSVDYSKGLIYKLCCKDPNIKDIYIGSTTNFNQRRRHHKFGCNKEGNIQYNQKKYQFIRDNGGWDNWLMIMVKEFSCDNKRQLEAEERKQMEELNATLNGSIPTRTEKEYMEENKEKLVEKATKWRKDNLNYRLKYEKEYRLKNKEKKNQTDKEYYIKNKEKHAEKAKEKIECDICKCMVRKYAFKRHTRTLKHQNNIDN